MEAEGSFETLVKIYQTTMRGITEGVDVNVLMVYKLKHVNFGTWYKKLGVKQHEIISTKTSLQELSKDVNDKLESHANATETLSNNVKTQIELHEGSVDTRAGELKGEVHLFGPEYIIPVRNVPVSPPGEKLSSPIVLSRNFPFQF
jgi:hypothetical protein